MTRFHRLAIAERGGAAMRCLAAVADLNTQADGVDPITTIALHGYADDAAWFVRAADEAVSLDVPVVADADVDTLLTAVGSVGADALWLGWNALACLPDLAARAAEAGIVVVGPGTFAPGTPDDGARSAAAGLGLPVTEATRGAGVRELHVQIASDGETVWELGVRDCSLQRDGQHVIIESGCAGLDEESCQGIRAAAAALTRAVGFTGLGSVEFLVDAASGRPAFRAFHRRLRPGHPVTEMLTGLDLVALQLVIARGARLTGEAPAPSGHAVEARLLAADPERDFAPTGGRLSFLRLPVGPGVRVDLGVTEGDVVASENDALLATVVAVGRDRVEAHARLRRAVDQLIVVIDAGTTTKAVVARELTAAEVREGTYDCGWLDRIVAAGDFLPPPDPLALLAAAVEAYDLEEAVVRDAFLASAARGRPALAETAGHRVELRLRGHRYALHVYRTGPRDYRVDRDGALVDVRVHRLSRYERAVACAGRSHRVVIDAQPGRMHVEVDGVPHTVRRDDGVVVRAELPAFVVDVRVEPGQAVTAGEPLLVLESMKMATTVSAPVDGVVAAVPAGVHTQVEVGAPLVTLRPSVAPIPTGPAVDLSVLEVPRDVEAAPAQVHARLRSLLLGFDLDPVAARRLPDAQRAAIATVPPDDAALIAHELELVEIFTDLCALSRRDPDPVDGSVDRTASAQEHLFSFLSSLDADRGDVPVAFLDRLRAALSRYGVTDLARNPDLELAVVQMYRSFLHALDQSWMVTAVLDRWLEQRTLLAPSFGDRHRAALSRLVHVMPGRSDRVAELAREVHYRYVDQPLLETAAASADAHVGEWLHELVTGADDERAAVLIRELVWCPRPLRARLRDAYLAADEPGRRRLLEARLRRFYRIRDLEDVRTEPVDGHFACVGDYRTVAGRVHVVSAYCPFDRLRDFLSDLSGTLTRVPRDRLVVVDLETWRDVPGEDIDVLARRTADLLDGLDLGRELHRLDLTVTSAGAEEEHRRTQHLTFRRSGASYVEDHRYRNLHPMIAKRLDLQRWSLFDLVRLASAEDVYLFAATARDNPADSRLVAVAEVRDLTPSRDSSGHVTGYPLLERMLSEAFTSIRHASAGRPSRERPLRNRVVLHVRPPWDVPAEVFRDIAHRWAPVSNGLGLEKVQLRVQLPDVAGDGPADAVIDVTGSADHGVTILVHPPDTEPVPTLSDYEQRVLKAERAGAPYPYELVRMLTPPPDAPSDFPAGVFDEHDLDESGDALVPVRRAPGRNTCGIVTGVLTSYTDTVPEGMSRVVLLGDPTRGLGNLAEAECRRINAAIDLAERRQLPLEWYALSSGARIAMDSGTENMDWISAVLRRLIEFTQAGGEVNVVVTGINVGAQPYWNAEATMLMHTRGVLIMTPASAMVLTGKSSLDYSGGVSAEDNTGIGGYERVMGPNGQGQYWAANLPDACALLLRHYDLTYVVPGESGPRRRPTVDPVDRDVRSAPHRQIEDSDLRSVGDIFSDRCNPDRKKPFDMRSVMRAVADADTPPLERWGRWRDAETAIVWDTRIGGIPVCLLGIESRPLPRSRFVPSDGPPSWTSGTLFPQSSRKLARAINAASGNRPLVVLANLSGFDGSPESMRNWQLEYGAEIGRAVTNFRGPIVFVVVSRYHGGAFVVFSKKLNENLEIAAVEGSFASVIGGAPAAAVVFAREVATRTESDSRIVDARAAVTAGPTDEQPALRRALAELLTQVRARKLKEVADEFDAIHDIRRAQRVGSVDLIVPARELRPYVIGALERRLGEQGRSPLATTSGGPFSGSDG